MVNETANKLIEKTLLEFKDKNIIAFLGQVGSGKTVVGAVFKYHLVKVWIPASKGDWESTSVKGGEAFNEIIRNMKQGIFTDSTPENNYPTLLIDVYSMQGKPVKTQLALHDMSGETYMKLLNKEYDDEERLIKILSGDGRYLAHAQHYVIMIDCEGYDNWDDDISHVATLIRSIQKIKNRIHTHNNDEPIHEKISIVFTKTDLLKDELRQKLPEMLLDDYPELRSALNSMHDKNSLDCFKVYVKSVEQTTENVEQQVKMSKGKLYDEFKQKKNLINTQTEGKINQAIHKAETNEDEQTEDELKIAKNNARQNVLVKTQNELDELEQKYEEEREKIENKEVNSEKTWEVENPFSYSESEYSRLISWIVTEKRDM